MPAPEGVMRKVASLLRLAAPTSGTTEAERSSAALEAAKLISEHGLIVVDASSLPPPPAPRRRAPAPPAAHRPIWRSVSEWREAVVMSPDLFCVNCHGPLSMGEIVWYDPRIGRRHHDITCDDPHSSYYQDNDDE